MEDGVGVGVEKTNRQHAFERTAARGLGPSSVRAQDDERMPKPLDSAPLNQGLSSV